MVPCPRPVYILSLAQFDHHAQKITTHVSGETTSVYTCPFCWHYYWIIHKPPGIRIIIYVCKFIYLFFNLFYPRDNILLLLFNKLYIDIQIDNKIKIIKRKNYILHFND